MTEKEEKALEKRAKKSVELIAKYQECFAGENGEDVIKDILKDCGIILPSFDPDPYRNAFNEGRKDVAFRLMRILQIDIHKYYKMIQEGLKPQDYTSI